MTFGARDFGGSSGSAFAPQANTEDAEQRSLDNKTALPKNYASIDQFTSEMIIEDRFFLLVMMTKGLYIANSLFIPRNQTPGAMQQIYPQPNS